MRVFPVYRYDAAAFKVFTFFFEWCGIVVAKVVCQFDEFCSGQPRWKCTAEELLTQGTTSQLDKKGVFLAGRMP